MSIRPELKWPLIITSALAIHVVAWLGVVYLATSDASYAVEEDYYRKAVDWDLTRAQLARNAELGWTLTAALEPAANLALEPSLAVSLSDREGLPLDGAVVEVEAFHNARADLKVRGRLTARGDGRYDAALPIRRPGVWELRFAAERDGRRFTEVDRLHVAGRR